MTRREIRLVYDPQCPVCDAYCRAVRASGSPPGLQLVSARAPGALMAEITRRGLDIDQGMVLDVDGMLHYGSAAIHALATLGATPGVFPGINRWLFASPRRAVVLYTALRAARNLLLKVLRRTRIDNLGRPGSRRF